MGTILLGKQLVLDDAYIYDNDDNDNNDDNDYTAATEIYDWPKRNTHTVSTMLLGKQLVVDEAYTSALLSGIQN